MKTLASTDSAILLLLLLLIAGISLCCVIVAPLMNEIRPNEPGAVFVFFCFGVIGAAAAIIAIVGVMPSWPFWFRLSLSFWSGTLLLGLWTVGLAASITARGQPDASTVLPDWAAAVCCYPLVFLAVQTPLWLTRALGNWTICRSNRAPAHQSWTIRDMLVCIGLIGFALAGAQFARQLNAPTFSSESSFWLAIGGTTLVCAFVSLLSVPPVILATLRSSNPVMGMSFLVCYAGLGLVGTFTVAGVIDGRFPRLFEFACVFITLSTFIIASCTPLLVVRQLGYRLSWGRQSNQHSPAAVVQQVS